MKTMILVLMVLSSCGEVPSAPVAQGNLQSEKTAPVADPATVKTDSAVIVNEAPVNGLGVETRAVKLTMDNCVDPDLKLVYKSVVLTMCDGTAGVGTYETPVLDNLLSENIKDGVVVGTVTGSFTGEAHISCDGDNQIGCVTTNIFKSAFLGGLRPEWLLAGRVVAGVTGTLVADFANLAPENVKEGVTVGTVLGTHVGKPADCSATDQVGCVTTTSFKPKDLTNLSAANIKVNVTVAGVTGTFDNRPANCVADRVVDCVTTSSWQSFNFNSLTAGNIYKGVTISGVTGTYPSGSNLLAGSDSTPDLDLATFDAKIKSGVSFEWFDSAGTRYVRSGDTDLADAANIKDAVTIFGTVGTMQAYVLPDPWDIRSGVAVNGITGKVKLNCQDGDDTTAATTCQSDVSWTDITTVSGNPATCAASAAVNCKYLDKVSGLKWARSSVNESVVANRTTTTVSAAQTYCSSLNIDGETGWRVPSRSELLQGFVQKVYTKADAKMFASLGVSWSSTTTSAGYYYYVQLSNAYTTQIAVPTGGSGSYVNCVK